ncbi:MAG: gliding motility protein GldN [Bacteroidales bacterium]|nr:gliding motility protein GldN [Bacteroidales bacterium]
MFVDSQQIINVYDRIHIREKKPIPYVPIREADVMWSKDIWRIIDLREKMNQQLYYPIDPIDQRMSLFGVIMHGIRENNLKAYADHPNKMFTTDLLMSETEIIQKIGADTVFGEVRLQTRDIKQFLVKEKWFFDKQHSTMRVRIMGMAPIRVYNQQIVLPDGSIQISPEVQYEIAFWVYFPEYRPLFAKYEIYNQNNDSNPISFDDLFIQRKFASFIFKESNVYQNRAIREYLTGDDILYEAERIKQELFQFEHDLWEY